ncbi:hypothetical protein EVAR_102874_1 [Eumeta japonica]|uniref:Uncharacterized protein n=1 Tax=Eumeta variegata TaxID=151549 RepID=A0A4C1UN66_EUMVA|nr:hypothetical protein EVAR_102874_1 [Eumeta japonica]
MSKQAASLVELITAGEENDSSGKELDVAVWDGLPLSGPGSLVVSACIIEFHQWISELQPFALRGGATMKRSSPSLRSACARAIAFRLIFFSLVIISNGRSREPSTSAVMERDSNTSERVEERNAN